MMLKKAFIRPGKFLATYLLLPFAFFAMGGQSDLYATSYLETGIKEFDFSPQIKQEKNKKNKKNKKSRSIDLSPSDFGCVAGSGAYFESAFDPLLPLSSNVFPYTYQTNGVIVAAIKIPNDFDPDLYWGFIMDVFTKNDIKSQSGIISFGITATPQTEGSPINVPPVIDATFDPSNLIGIGSRKVKQCPLESIGSYYTIKIPCKKFLMPGKDFVFQLIRKNNGASYPGSIFCFRIQLVYNLKSPFSKKSSNACATFTILCWDPV